MKKITLLFLCLFALFLSNEAYSQCTTFSGGGPYTDLNTAFGGAPCDDGTGCPFNEIDAFEAWADESYLLDNVLLGNTYTFSICNGPGAGTWPVSFTIIAPSGNIDASGTDAGSTCALTWTATEEGTYTIGISEDGIPCDTSTNTATNNGFPAITCTDGSAPCQTIDCNYTLPYTETFDDDGQFTACYITEDVDADGISWISQQDLDLDGDGVNETFATNGNSTANTKNDWLFSPPLSLTSGTEYNVTSIFNTFGGNGSLEAFIVDAASSTATQIATLFSQTNIVPQGEFATLETSAYQEINSFTPGTDGDYYIAYHSFGPASSGFILLFDSNLESLLSVDEFQSNLFTHFYNKTTDILSLESSNSAFDNVSIYNILGQQVKTQRLYNTSETVDMSSLTDGVYLVKVTLQGKTKTVKIIKH